MSVISNLGLLWFGLTCSMIDAENSRHFLNQSDLKLKLIATWSVAFSRALRSLNVSLLARCDIYIYIYFFFIRCCDNFGFGFTTLNRNQRYV